MGTAAGPGLAAAGSIASAGFGLAASSEKAKGIELQAEGVNAGNQFQAAELDRAAEYGDLKAVQTGAQMTQKLNMTLGNIDAIRAASHTDPTSPTGAAFRDAQEDIGITQKTITVDNILAQSRKQEAEAAYLRVAGANALLAGKVGANAARLGGYADFFGKLAGAGGGSGGGGDDKPKSSGSGYEGGTPGYAG